MRIVTPLSLQLSNSPPMLHQNASILDHHYPGRPRPLRRRFVLNSRLHPNHLSPNANRALHHQRHILRPPEHIHNFYFLRHILQPRITLLPQHVPLVRVHRNNPVARTLHVFRHAKTRPRRIRRQSDHRNTLVFFQEFENRITAGLRDAVLEIIRATREQYSHRAASSPLPARFKITRAMADKHLSFSSAVPTEMRIASGNPIHPSGRTITPICSRSSLIACASGPATINTKFASLGTGRNPILANPSLKRFRSVAFVSMQRATCSLSSSAASAAACATPVVLNGVLNLFIAESSPGRPMAYPMRNPANPYTFENVRRMSRFFLLR